MAAIQNFVGQWTQPADPPAGFAKTHGRIEATRVMITTKLAGKIQEVLVREGDTVDAGQVVARMDTRSLKAQFRKAEAQVQKGRDAKNTAAAVVAERESELEVATRNFARRKELLPTGGASKEDFDVAQSKMETAKAALQEARSQVIESASAIEAAIAEVDRLRVDIEDCSLVAPVRGRIQYRLAEPLEVLDAGGRVVDLIELTDVYMILYLPEEEAGRPQSGPKPASSSTLPRSGSPRPQFTMSPPRPSSPRRRSRRPRSARSWRSRSGSGSRATSSGSTS